MENISDPLPESDYLYQSTQKNLYNAMDTVSKVLERAEASRAATAEKAVLPHASFAVTAAPSTAVRSGTVRTSTGARSGGAIISMAAMPNAQRRI